MATIARGPRDKYVRRVKITLDEYERQHPGAIAGVYRQEHGSIRIRIVDRRFVGKSDGERHDAAWGFISDRLDMDVIEEVSMLILVTPSERRSSYLSTEFDDPLPSRL